MKKKNFLHAFIFFIITALTIYFGIFPAIVSNNKSANFICKKISQNLGISVIIKNPELRTYPNLNIRFDAEQIYILAKEKDILKIENLETNFSVKGLLFKKIYINKLQANSIFTDLNQILLLSEKDKKTNDLPSAWKLDLYDSILKLNNAVILYSPNNTDIALNLRNLSIDNTQKTLRYIHFDFETNLIKSTQKTSIKISDNNKFFIKDKCLHIDNAKLNINNSIVNINAIGTQKNGLSVNLSSTNFSLDNLANILNTNLILQNGEELISYLKDFNGSVDFDLKIRSNSLNGKICLNKAFFKLVPLNNLPISLKNGIIEISPQKIVLNNFNGYYGTSTANSVSLNGSINNYISKINSKIIIKTALNNEFCKNYLSKTVGLPIEIEGLAGTKITISSILNDIDISVLTGLAKGYDFLIDGQSLTPKDYDRALKADLKIREKFLNIENINYYIASELKKGVIAQPIVTLRGQFDISKQIPEIIALGFEVPKPLPSEFLNLLIGQRLFKGGIFEGKLYYINKNNNPTIRGNLSAENIRIPMHRLFIQKAGLNTDNKLIHLVSNGRYKRSDFVFVGNIANTLKYPIIIKELDFQLDKLDLEKLLNSFQQPINNSNSTEIDNTTNDNAVTFDIKNIIIENSIFKLKEGVYKDINFGNLTANMTLDKNGKLELKSNKFNIAEGLSSVKALCDFGNKKYYLKLGVKDVNSDLISSTLLNLPKEISGKASGLIELNTDNSFKLNGNIKFKIKDGEIPKVGLVEYLIKFVTLFRNPIVAISPSILSDIVNVPEGKFDNIEGSLDIENNFVKLIKITSSAPQLSSYIVGCYNLETGDSILRIYTKFTDKNKGLLGFVRNLSLSNLARKIPLTSTANINYYKSELENLPKLEADEKDCQIFLTTIDGDLVNNNFLSSLKKIK